MCHSFAFHFAYRHGTTWSLARPLGKRRQRLELESIINEALKRKIAVTGRDSISAPEHDTFDNKVLRALNDPNGADFSVTASVEDVEDEGDGLQYQR